VNERVFKWVKRVALDTARGRTLEIAHRLYRTGKQGTEAGFIAHWIGETSKKTFDLLRFLQAISVVESIVDETSIIRRPSRWRLTDRFSKLYSEVMKEVE
jgi:hypothetical protein